MQKISALSFEQKSLSTHKHKQYIFIISHHGCVVKIYVNIDLCLANSNIIKQLIMNCLTIQIIYNFLSSSALTIPFIVVNFIPAICIFITFN